MWHDELMHRTAAIGYVNNLPVSDGSAFVAREIDVPPLKPHDILVEVAAVSVNPVDVKLRASADPGGFRVLGFDAAGTVRAIGPAVTLFTVGDDVFYAGSVDRPGSNQRLHAVDERIVGRKPASLTFADAASLPLTAITAWECLFDRLRLAEDSVGTLLVVGATGGVGSVLLQLAEALLPDVTVIATASDTSRAAWVRELGAEQVVTHHEPLAQQVLHHAPAGVDWVFTAHSAGQVTSYAELLRPFGEIVAIDDGPRDISPLKTKSVSWHWERMFTRPMFETADIVEQHRLLNAVADLVDRGSVRPTTSTSLTPISLATLREAHALVESGRTVGKVVIHGWE